MTVRQDGKRGRRNRQEGPIDESKRKAEEQHGAGDSRLLVKTALATVAEAPEDHEGATPETTTTTTTMQINEAEAEAAAGGLRQA